MTAAARTSVEHCNEVRIVGRLSAPALTVHLPSGDEVVNWRLVVERPHGAGRSSVDTVNCVGYLARVRKQALTWEKDEVIEVSGSLRRRFWRAATGAHSRYEVEVRSASRAGGPVKRPRKPG
jgi:single-strand DNA-binding protein